MADIILVPNEFGSFDLKTPNGTNGMFRESRFSVSKSKNINDGVNSPIEDSTWRNPSHIAQRITFLLMIIMLNCI